MLKRYEDHIGPEDVFGIADKNYDTRTIWQVYQDLKKEDPNIVVEIVPSQSLSSINFLPLSGISNSKTIACNENGYYSNYQSDRYGFNNPDINYDNFTKKKVMLIGDSFVHGACVDEENTLSSQLNKINIPSFPPTPKNDFDSLQTDIKCV